MDCAPFLKACRGEKTLFTPVWLMRQAGRYMKEYRALRAKVPFERLCKSPDLCAEAAVFAAERLGVDAAILFSDILLILEPMGLRLTYEKGEGPVIHNPVRTPKDLKRLRRSEPESMDYVYRAVRATRAGTSLPLIGFSGAPFTLACYAIEGGGSKDFAQAKRFMRLHPEAFRELMTLLTDSLMGYLKAQVSAGAEVLQVFDSWVGVLPPSDYRAHALPHTKRLVRALSVPVIHFGTRTAGFLEDFAEAGDVIGLDASVPLRRIGRKPVMGNLDPTVLLADRKTIRREVRRVLKEAGGRPGHIFNLGHGVLPQTPVGNARYLVDQVHEGL